MIGVWTDKSSAGVLDGNGQLGSTFVYNPGTAPRRAVSVTMPVCLQSWDTPLGVAPIFEMNLPEGALRERLRLAFAKGSKILVCSMHDAPTAHRTKEKRGSSGPLICSVQRQLLLSQSARKAADRAQNSSAFGGSVWPPAGQAWGRGEARVLTEHVIMESVIKSFADMRTVAARARTENATRYYRATTYGPKPRFLSVARGAAFLGSEPTRIAMAHCHRCGVGPLALPRPGGADTESDLKALCAACHRRVYRAQEL